MSNTSTDCDGIAGVISSVARGVREANLREIFLARADDMDGDDARHVTTRDERLGAILRRLVGERRIHLADPSERRWKAGPAPATA